MKILINCSNLQIGGGLQVAHSFLNEIKNDVQHQYVVILSKLLNNEVVTSDFSENFKFFVYDIKPHPVKTIFGNDIFLSNIEVQQKIDVVFSVFGPTYWKPAVKHFVGYAKPQYIYTESPFFSRLSFLNKAKLKFKRFFHMFDFSKNNDCLITENEGVTMRLRRILGKKQVITVTNYYNQIFDNSLLWNKDIKLPEFNGFSLLMISANYPHKNFAIIPEAIKYLNMHFKGFNFRFILTVEKEIFNYIDDFTILDRIVTLGKVDINQCPFLYSQCQAVFLPTLLECFTATYPEAMRMKKPILTSDLNFATGLCGNAAIYFDPLSPKDIAEKIYDLATNPHKQGSLIDEGLLQLKKFDNYKVRAKKYLDLITS